MRRTTLAAVICAACGIDVVGQAPNEAAPGAPTGTDAGPGAAPTATATSTATSDGAAPPPSDDGGVDGGSPKPPTSSLMLSPAGLPTSADVDLTTLGKIDWVNWGVPKTRKATSAQAIVNLTTSGSLDCTSYDFPCSLKWSDGTSPTNFDGHAGRCIFAPNAFYAFDVAATTTPRTLTLLLGAYQAKGKLTVTLSDGTPPLTDDSLDNKTESMATIQYNVTFFAAAASGTSLHVDWRDESQRPNGSVYLGSAALHE